VLSWSLAYITCDSAVLGIAGAGIGFIFIAPLLVVGTTPSTTSSSTASGVAAALHPRRTACRRLMVFALILMIVFLVWWRAPRRHVFFPMDAGVPQRDYVQFLFIGSIVGTIFAAIIFSTAAFGADARRPQCRCRHGVVTSVNAVLRNSRP
jgi:hypothetical protein